MSLSRASIVSLFAVTLAAQACGGDDDDGGGSGSPSTTSTTSSTSFGGTSPTGSGGNTNPTGGNGGTSNGGSSAGGTSNGGSSAGGSSGGSGGTTTTDAGGTGGSGGDPSTTGTGGSAGDSTTGEGGAPAQECNPPFEEGAAGAAGAAAAAFPQVIATFDDAGSAVGWEVYVDGNSVGSVGDAFGYRSMDDGRSCAGSMAVEIPYDRYAESLRVSLERGLGSPGLDWTGATKAHLSIRIEEPESGNLAHLSWGNFFIQSDGWGIWTQVDLNYGQLSDFGWHEFVIDLTTATPLADLSNINQIGIQIAPHSAAPGNAPAVPPHTIVYVDDIWVE